MARRPMTLRLVGVIVVFAAPASLRAEDWTRWGRHRDRNMVSDEKHVPTTFDPDPAGSSAESDCDGRTKWVARLGTHSYGNPVVADGRVYVGTNDASAQDSRFKRTKGGMVLCLDEATGKLLWKLLVPRFRKYDNVRFHFDHLNLGICSSVTVEGDRAYVVSSRAEVLCLDVHGQANGNDGPFVDEGLYMSDGKRKDLKPEATDADIIWLFDMVDGLPDAPQDAHAGVVLIDGDFLYIGTSNGVDKSHKKLTYPDAPSLIVMDKKTGRLLAKDDEKIGHRLFHGQWSSPALGEVNGRKLIFFGGGDGVCYAFEPLTARPPKGKVAILEKVWSCDCNPPEYRFRDGKPIKYRTKGDGPSEIIATPVFHKDRVYVTIGQDPRHKTGKGALTCIDATRTGDVSKTGILWQNKLVDRSLSTVSIADGLVYVADYSGRLHCFDAETGRRCWVQDLNSPLWSSTLVADGKVYIGTERRDFWVLAAGRTRKVLAKTRLRAPMYNTPVVANGVLYVATERHVFAVRKHASGGG